MDRSKLLKQESNVFGNQDKISSLPDSLLHCILAFLPTKFAVSTSILSTRWRYLWTFVPFLDFSDDLFLSKKLSKRKSDKTFMKFVDRVLFLLDVPNIRKFSLKCSEIHDESRINSWMSTILKRNVEQVNLHIGHEICGMLPRNFFTCESLERLKIQSDSILRIPELVCFSSLRNLHLLDIKFVCGHSSQHVCFTFPVLEEFVLEGCGWSKIKIVTIIAPKLTTFTIDDHSCNEANHRRECEIRVHAESLTSLKLTSSLSYEFSIYNMTALIKASLHISSPEDINLRASKLLKGICNAKELIMSDATVVVFTGADLRGYLRAFSNLVQLKIIVGHNDFLDEESELTVVQLIHLLCHLSNVESFGFTNDSVECAFKGDVSSLWKFPRCSLPNLKSVELDCFYGDKNEIILVYFLLKFARSLEKLTIISSSTLSHDPDEQIKVVRVLHRAPKSSKIVLVGFSAKLETCN